MFPHYAVSLPAVPESEKHRERYAQTVGGGGGTNWVPIEARWTGRRMEGVRADDFGAHCICCLHGTRVQRDGPSYGGNSR